MKESKKHPAPEAAAEVPAEEEGKQKPQPVRSDAGTPAGESAGAAGETTPAEEPTELEKTRIALAEVSEKYIYLQAEYQNYRKRVSKELSGVRSAAVADTLHPFLTVCDFLNMADVAAATSDNVESIRQGLKMIIGEFTKAFDELGVKSFSAVGEKFDPAFHEAVAGESSDTVPEGVVIRQWSGGFKLGETVLRPARVVVSSGPAKPEAAGEGKENPKSGETSAAGKDGKEA